MMLRQFTTPGFTRVGVDFFVCYYMNDDFSVGKESF